MLSVSRPYVRALEEGIPYQTLMASILHKYVGGRLVDRAVAAQSVMTMATTGQAGTGESSILGAGLAESQQLSTPKENQ